MVGPNGGGKSTLLKIIAGLLRPNSGEIFLNGKLVEKNHELRNLVGFVPQVGVINQTMPISILEFLELERKLNGASDFTPIMKRLGLDHIKDRTLRTLSGGEKQRVLLARALVRNPKILILDEPATGLDSTGQDQLLGIVRDLQKESEGILIIVDHNLGQVIKMADKLICLNKSFHWHDYKKNLSKEVLTKAYHCEFEHLLIHENDGALLEHHFCDGNHQHEEDS